MIITILTKKYTIVIMYLGSSNRKQIVTVLQFYNLVPSRNGGLPRIKWGDWRA